MDARGQAAVEHEKRNQSEGQNVVPITDQVAFVAFRRGVGLGSDGKGDIASWSGGVVRLGRSSRGIGYLPPWQVAVIVP